MELEDNNLNKRERAKKRVEELKGFYIHLMVYVLVNTMITIVKVVRNMHNGETFTEAFWDFSTGAIWFWWGIGLAFHASKVFSINPIFNKDWEDRQIQKYMDDDKKESEKYS